MTGLITSLPYIPSDEFFLRTKNSTFVAAFIKGALQAVIPTIDDAVTPGNSFSSLQDVKDLYNTTSPSVNAVAALTNYAILNLMLIPGRSYTSTKSLPPRERTLTSFATLCPRSSPVSHSNLRIFGFLSFCKVSSDLFSFFCLLNETVERCWDQRPIRLHLQHHI